LIKVVEFVPSEAGPTSRTPDHGFVRYVTPALEFTAWRGDLNHHRLPVPATKSCRVALATDGEAELRGPGGAIDLDVGQAALIPYGEEVTAAGSATLFITAPGV
jgi:mannose-6-phosphate isomerase class I